MPMSPRLLRPRASGLIATDADARAYISAVQIADASSLEPAVQRAINDFVVGCKADGIWSAIKASCILMGARTLSGALTPLVGSAPTNNGPFVSGDYNRETGLVGNASSKYLDSNRNNNAQALGSQHMAFYASTADTGSGMYLGVTTSDLIQRASSFNFRSRSVSLNLDNTGFAGFQGVNRSSTTAWLGRGNGADTTGSTTTVSGSPTNANIFIYCRNNSGPQLYSNARLAFYSIGDSLDLALLDTRVTNLYNAIGAAI
jgi:hypothetical protein